MGFLFSRSGSASMMMMRASAALSHIGNVGMGSSPSHPLRRM